MGRPDIEAVIGANEAGFLAAMNRVRASGKSASSGLSADFNKIGSGLTRLNGMLLGLGAGLSFETIRNAIQSVGDIGDVADRVGLTTKALQEMRFAAEQNGASAEVMDASLEIFAKRVSESASGAVSSFSEILKANNIELRNQDGSLRNQADIFADYANLVQRAANDQDQARLATEAFGKAGIDLVGVLEQGSSGLDDMAKKAGDLGVVLEDDMVRAAQAMGDEFDAVVASMKAGFQSLVVYAARAAVEIGKAFTFIENRPAAQLRDEFSKSTKDAQRLEGSGNFINQIKASNAKAVAENARKEILRRAFEDAKINGGNEAQGSLRDDLINGSSQKIILPAIIPDEGPTGSTGGRSRGGGGSRGGSAKAAREERDAVAELIERLEQERSLIGASETEKRIANETRRAGADATDAQKQKIAELVTAIEAEEAAQKKVKQAIEDKKKAADYFASSSVDALFSVLDGSAKASDALKKLALDFAKAALQAQLLGTGPLAGVFGGGGKSGGFLGSIFGALFGARADGGPVTAGKIYRVGERGPEYFRPNTSGSIIPNGGGGAGGNMVTVQQHFTIAGAINDKTVFAMMQNAAQQGARMAREAMSGDLQAIQIHGGV